MTVRASTAVLLLALVAITLNRVGAYPIIAEIDEDDETVSQVERAWGKQAHLAQGNAYPLDWMELVMLRGTAGRLGIWTFTCIHKFCYTDIISHSFYACDVRVPW